MAVDIDAWTADVCIPSQVEPVTVSLDQFGLLPPEEKAASAPAEPPNDLVLFEAGDEVEFEENGKTLFAEIVSIDDARNEAVIEVLITGERITVRQDDLTKYESEDLSDDEEPIPRPIDSEAQTELDEIEQRDSLAVRLEQRSDDETSQQPFTIREIRELHNRLVHGNVTRDELREEFLRFVASRDTLIQ